jgi:hypothetical protein
MQLEAIGALQICNYCVILKITFSCFIYAITSPLFYRSDVSFNTL